MPQSEKRYFRSCAETGRDGGLAESDVHIQEIAGIG